MRMRVELKIWFTLLKLISWSRRKNQWDTSGDQKLLKTPFRLSPRPDWQTIHLFTLVYFLFHGEKHRILAEEESLVSKPCGTALESCQACQSANLALLNLITICGKLQSLAGKWAFFPPGSHRGKASEEGHWFNKTMMPISVCYQQFTGAVVTCNSLAGMIFSLTPHCTRCFVPQQFPTSYLFIFYLLLFWTLVLKRSCMRKVTENFILISLGN